MILSGAGITTTGGGIITGNVGSSPIAGSAIGVTCAQVIGTIYAVDASGPPCAVVDASLLTTAKGDLTTAYNDAAGRTPVPTGPNLNPGLIPGSGNIGGMNLAPGLYKFTTTALITGSDVTLTGGPDDVWIFQCAQDLQLGSGIKVILAGGAQAKNVFWQVGTSAVLGTFSVFKGTILADQAVTMNTSSTIEGRALAFTASVVFNGAALTRPGAASPAVDYGCQISHWKFDETNGVAALDSADGNHGTLVNGPVRVAGRVGSGALRLDGVNDFVRVPNSPSLHLKTNWTIAMWFKPSQLLNAGSGRRDLFKKFASYWLLFNYPSGDGKLAFVLNTGTPIIKSTTSAWPSNQWQHVAATYDGTMMRLYINGALEASGLTSALPANNTNPIEIGGSTEYRNFFPGCIDDVSMFCTNLAASTVLALYNSSTNTPPPPPSTNTPPVISDIASRSILTNTHTGDVPFTVGDAETPATLLTVSGTSGNTTLVPNANITFGGSGSNRTVRVTPAANQSGSALITITVSDGVLTASDTFTLTVTNGPAINPPPGTNALISHWKFNESGGEIALDSANGNPGWLMNGPLHVTGTNGGALQFDGVNDHVKVQDSASLDLGKRFTIAFWFRPSVFLNAGSGRKDLFQKFLSYWVILNYPANDGKLVFVLNSGTPLVKSTTTSWPPNQWQHVAASYDGTTMKLYVNGTLEGSASATAQPANTSYPLQIGGNTTQGYWFPGAMDDVRLYGAPLSAADVAALAAGTPAPAPSLVPASIQGLVPRLHLSYLDGIMRLSWKAVPGASYRVQYQARLNGGEWTDLGDEILASGTEAAFEEPTDGQTQRFYRVLAVP